MNEEWHNHMKKIAGIKSEKKAANCRLQSLKLAKLTHEKVIQIRKAHPGRCVKDIADEHGVSKWAIYKIINNKAWKDVK